MCTIITAAGLMLCVSAVSGAVPGEGGLPAVTIPRDHPLRRMPTVAESSEGRAVCPELLGTPEVRVLLGYTRRALHLHDGVAMGLFSFSNSAPANWLFLIESRDLSFERHAIPNNDIASHGAALGADGHIYIMPYGTARAYRFDTEAREFTDLATDLPEGEYTWDAFGGSNGRIYFGTYPNAYFGEYDPKTDDWYLEKQVAPNTKYVRAFSEDPDGQIRFRAVGPDEVWMTFDPQTRALDRIAPPQPPPAPKPPQVPVPEGDDSFGPAIEAAGRWFAVGRPSGRVWELAPQGEAVLRGDTRTPAEPTWWLKATPEAVVGVSYYGSMFRYDLETGTFECAALDNRAPGGNAIMFLETVTPRCAIGANYSQQNLFTIDPEAGAVVESDRMVARVTGEPMCAVGFGGRAYVGIYVNSILSVYDPDRPFAFGENPRELIELGPRYAQTRPRAAVTDGRFVFISSDSAYNHLGGALAVIDPQTEQIDVYHHLIRDQNLPTLAYDPTTRLLWGGTDRWGQMRSHPPTQDSSLIYAFDPETREVVETLTAWEGSDVTSVHGVLPSGVLVASSGDEVALVDTRARDVLYLGPSPIGVPGRIRLGADGWPYCLSGGTLYRWDWRQNRLTPLARTEDCVHLTESSPGLWLLANARSVFRLRVSEPPAPRARARASGPGQG